MCDGPVGWLRPDSRPTGIRGAVQGKTWVLMCLRSLGGWTRSACHNVYFVVDNAFQHMVLWRNVERVCVERRFLSKG